MAARESGRKARLRERLAQARAAFVAVVQALAAEDLTRPAGHESDWTVHDLIGHVAYAESSMLPMIGGPLAGTPHQVPPGFDLDRWNASRVSRAREQTIPQLLARLEESRRQALALLDSMSDADLDRPTSHPLVPETTIEGIYKIIAFHERGHTKELRAIRDGARLHRQQTQDTV